MLDRMVMRGSICRRTYRGNEDQKQRRMDCFWVCTYFFSERSNAEANLLLSEPLELRRVMVLNSAEEHTKCNAKAVGHRMYVSLFIEQKIHQCVQKVEVWGGHVPGEDLFEKTGEEGIRVCPRGVRAEHFGQHPNCLPAGSFVKSMPFLHHERQHRNLHNTFERIAARLAECC